MGRKSPMSAGEHLLLLKHENEELKQENEELKRQLAAALALSEGRRQWIETKGSHVPACREYQRLWGGCVCELDRLISK